jgi:hypothetical protein
VPDRVKFLPIATCCPLAGSVIFTPSDVCCCGKALTEEMQIVDVKRLSGDGEVAFVSGGHDGEVAFVSGGEDD